MDKIKSEPKRGSAMKEMDELREKFKTRSTKLQEKFIKFHEKLGHSGSENKDQRIKSTTPRSYGHPQQRRRTFSQTSTGCSNGNNCEASTSNIVNSTTDDKGTKHDNRNELRSKIARVRGKLLDSEKLSGSNDRSTRSHSYSERSLIRTNSCGSQNYGQKSKRSISLTISETESLLPHDNEELVGTKKSRRRRGQRGSGSKNKHTQATAEHIPIYARETESLNINAETLLILDLLLLPLKDHKDFLIKLAKTRKILIKSSDQQEDFQLNPKILRLKPVLLLGDQCRNFNDAERKRLEELASVCTGHRTERVRLTSEVKRYNEERRSKIFEDYVNALIYEELPEDRRKEFLFPALPKRQRTKNYFCRPEFEESLENFVQKCVAANLGRIVESDIRINAKNNDQAFIKNVDGERDAFLCSQLARKYALHGDIVRVFVRNNSDCKKSEIASTTTTIAARDPLTEELNLLNPDAENLDTTIEEEEECPVVAEKNARAFVIKIIKQVHNRKCVGNFLSYRKDSEFITFVPRDMKMPNIKIFKKDWPEAFQKGELDNVSDILYVAMITDWKNDMCIGTILHPVGKCGELESENKAILLQNDLHMDPYDEKFNEMFKEPLVLDQNIIKGREDLRSECIFTIDPLTARDLDDAMSCKELPDGNLEIGVHISDVAYFLEEESELDQIVKMRTTSVYMVNEVFHMLPKPLCYKCSLLPGEDKLAFSVFWVMAKNGDILNTRFSRTIINSCTQFAYEHVQKIIDYPDNNYSEQDFPQIHNGFTVSDIVKRVKNLHSIAEQFRLKRFENGALKINKPKLYFELHPEIGEPINYGTCVLQTANFLIEEFMLLANQSVADFIWRKFPNLSILRSHQAPLKNMIQKVKEKLEKFDMQLDISSSRRLYESFNKLLSDSNNPEALEACLSQIVSKPMARARYFCSDSVTDKSEFWHFALSIPIYTHFTSPIRRYPDVMVHRVLSAALGYTPPPQRLPHELDAITSICNEKKYTAKLAGEDSCNLYFLHYVKAKKSILMRAAISELCSGSMEIVLIDSGHTMRLQYPRGGEKNDAKIVLSDKENPRTALLTYNSQPNLPAIELKTFSEIQVEVFVEKLKLKVRIPSKQPTKNNSEGNKKNNSKISKDKIDECPILTANCVSSLLENLNLTDTTEIKEDNISCLTSAEIIDANITSLENTDDNLHLSGNDVNDQLTISSEI